jgi:hypothetical protein
VMFSPEETKKGPEPCELRRIPLPRTPVNRVF